MSGKTLDNDYSGNVVDICPVGALTDKDFRFKRRVWYINGHAPSVEEVIARVSARIESTIAKQGAGSIAVVASASSSNEDLFLLNRLFIDKLKVQNVDVTFGFEQKGKEDELLKRADLTPNRRGALELKIKPWGGDGHGGDELLAAAVEGEFDVLVVVRHDLSKALSERELAKLRKNTSYIVYLSSHENGLTEIADDVLPLAMWAEREATYTNFQGRVQKTAKPLDPRGMAIPEWEIWQKLGSHIGLKTDFATAQQVFDGLGAHNDSFKGLTWESLGSSGKLLNGTPEPAYKRVQTSSPLSAY
ncbi:MAG: molybdopterin-dependent oxidoreductase [bacterium]|nr:molybdopterin-dependent oxidoreductase [bacterium]